MRRSPWVYLVLIAVLLGVAGCGAQGSDTGSSAGQGELVVYSGRQEQLVSPLIDQFRRETGINVSVRYGDTAQLAAQLIEEGERTTADVYFSQDGGALGALTRARRLQPLPAETLHRVDPRYRADDGTWVGVSGRSRVVVYDPSQVAPADLPRSVFELTDPKWRGQVGIAPSNASFESFVTAMRVLHGDDATQRWLEGMRANQVQVFDNNVLILNAAQDRVIKVGLINHYYWYEQVAEEGEAAVPARLHYLPSGDPGALVNVAGVGILAGSDRMSEAQRFADFLLSPSAQAYFAEHTKEFPLIPGVPTAPGLPPLHSLQTPNIDLSNLDTLEQTLEMIQKAGLT